MIERRIFSATAVCHFKPKVTADNAWGSLVDKLTRSAAGEDSATRQYAHSPGAIESHSHCFPLVVDGLIRVGDKSNNDPIEPGDIFKYRDYLTTTSSLERFIKITDWKPNEFFAYNMIRNGGIDINGEVEQGVFTYGRREFTFQTGVEGQMSVAIRGAGWEPEKEKKKSWLPWRKGDLTKTFRNEQHHELARDIYAFGGTHFEGTEEFINHVKDLENNEGRIALPDSEVFKSVSIRNDGEENTLTF